MKRWLLYTLVFFGVFAGAWTYSVRTEPGRQRDAMTEALRRKDAAEVRRLLGRGFDPRFQTEWGESPLTLFSDLEDRDGMKWVLEAGVDPNALGPKLASPLEQAIGRGDFQTARMLLEVGADPNASCGWEESPLYIAISAPVSEVERLQLVQALVEHGADVDTVADYDGTPLRAAIIRNQTSIVRYLLSKGANPRLTSPEHGDDPLTLVSSPSYGPAGPELAKSLRKAIARRGSLTTRLLAAVKRRDGRALVSCLSEGGNPNLRTWHGDTLLHVAVRNGDLLIVGALLRGEANVELANAAGLTPLTLAAIKGHLSIVQYLVAVGAKVDGGPFKSSQARVRARADSPVWRFLKNASQARAARTEAQP